MRKIICLLCLVIGLPVITAAKEPTPPNRPNFIVILVDDLGWTSFSSGMDNRYPKYKSTYFETPNIDKLGNEGMRFSNGYISPICTPSRRSIQFGQSSVKVGKKNFPRKYNPNNKKWLTIPWMLNSIDQNYRTAHYGKWDFRAGFSPEDIGYDESDGNTKNDNGDRMVDKSDKFTRVYLTDDPKRIFSNTGRALNFMHRQVESGHPFFLQISYYATHIDLETKKETYQRFLRKKKDGIQNSAGYAGMLKDMDTGIGKILDMVHKLEISDNTYIFLLADNGGVELFPPDPSRLKLEHTKTYNYPLRGGKWVLYEGGIRVPFIVAGPEIPSKSYSHVPVRGFDILPTISELANNPRPLPNYLDGGSIKPLFENPKNGTVVRPKKAFYFHRFTEYYGHSAIIEGDYKLLIRWKTDNGFKKNKVELYDLKNDLSEANNLAKQMPKKVSKLKRKLISYLEKEDIDIPQDDIQSVLSVN